MQVFGNWSLSVLSYRRHQGEATRLNTYYARTMEWANMVCDFDPIS